ncbi:MAG TPA: FixH family protein [Thermodesulfovibrionales bacterium]|nr:FixH family protein [Thermodesulfovibrionales bacterium]
MKKLIYLLYGAFFVLMGITFYVAHHVNDGLVEHNYYEKSLAFFDKKQTKGTTQPELSSPDCETDKGPCSKTIGRMTIIIDIAPKPVKAMAELAFTLTITGNPAPPPELILNLGMPGMYMGSNRVILRRGRDGTYMGEGIIPRCPSGKRLWSAAVNMPGSEKVRFTFDVSN